LCYLCKEITPVSILTGKLAIKRA